MSSFMRVLPVLAAVIIILAAGAVFGDDRVPVFVDCPDTILILHCDVAQFQLHATDPKHDHPNDNNIRYHLIEGPGQIDWRTGLWSWRPIDDSVFFGWHEVVVAASIGNSEPHTTPPEDCCTFSVYVGDHTPSIKVGGEDPYSVFFVDAPGAYAYDIELTDEDPCDTPIVEIVKIEPEPTGTIQMVDSQLVLDLTADDDETRFVVYFAFVQNERRVTMPYVFDTRDNPMPVFTTCPQDTTVFMCSHLRREVLAQDPDYPDDHRFIELSVTSGPGRAYPGRWMGAFEPQDSGQTFEVEIAASYGPLTTSGDQNCRFSVNVESRNIGLSPVGFSDGDTIDLPAARETELVIEALGEDCRTIRQTQFTLTPEPVGYYHVGGPFGLDWYRFYKAVLVPDTVDIGHYFDLSLVGSDGINEYSVHCTIHVVEAEPFVVAIDKVDDVNLGDTVSLEVVMQQAPADFSDFYLHIVYNRNDFDIINVYPADPLFDSAGCGWEYFNFNQGFVGDEAGMTLLQVFGGAHYPYDPVVVLDCLRPASTPATLFTIEAEVTSNPALAGQFLPLDFYWPMCTANSIHLRYQDRLDLYFAGDVFDAQGNRLAMPDSLPSNSGVPLDCYGDDPSHNVYQAIDFHHGGIQLSSGGVPLDADDSDPDGIPGEYAVRQNYPNPFNATTVVSFDLPRQSDVSFEVYNLLGQVVYSERQTLSAGSHQVEWNGRNSVGQNVSSGIYFYRLSTEGFVQTKKMILMK